jgi:hypothetical protein
VSRSIWIGTSPKESRKDNFRCSRSFWGAFSLYRHTEYASRLVRTCHERRVTRRAGRSTDTTRCAGSFRPMSPSNGKEGVADSDYGSGMNAFRDTRTHTSREDFLWQTKGFLSVEKRGSCGIDRQVARYDSIGATRTIASQPPIRTRCCNGAAITQIRIDGRVSRRPK